MKIYCFKLLILSALLLPIMTWANNIPSFTVSAPECTELEDQFQLTFTISLPDSISDANEIHSFVAPDLSNFKILIGPLRSRRIQKGENVIIHKYSFSYILQGVQTGDFTIKPASIIVRGEQMHSQEISIKVVKSGEHILKERKVTDDDPIRDFFNGRKKEK